MRHLRYALNIGFHNPLTRSIPSMRCLLQGCSSDVPDGVPGVQPHTATATLMANQDIRSLFFRVSLRDEDGEKVAPMSQAAAPAPTSIQDGLGPIYVGSNQNLVASDSAGAPADSPCGTSLNPCATIGDAIARGTAGSPEARRGYDIWIVLLPGVHTSSDPSSALGAHIVGRSGVLIEGLAGSLYTTLDCRRQVCFTLICTPHSRPPDTHVGR